VRSLLLTKPIESLVLDRSISIVIWTHLPRSRSGLATLLTVKISADLIQMMEDLNRSYKVANLGEGVADATIRFLHRHDREPTWPQPASGLAL
jgi:hypothetical protein